MKQWANAVVVMGLGAVCACGDPFEGCEATKTCPPRDQSGGAGGEGADAGSGGNQADGGTHGGTRGEAGNEGADAASGAGGQLAPQGGAAGRTSDGGVGAGGDAGSAGAAGAIGADDPCEPDPCDHGACTAANSKASCVCAAGYTGERCSLPRFQPLPISLGATFYHVAGDLSGDGGTAVGYVESTTGARRPFRWTADSGLEDLTSRLGTAYSLTGVSENGAVLTGTTDSAVYRWASGGTPTALPIPEYTAWCGRDGAAISHDGSTVVAICGCSSATDPCRGVRWSIASGLVAETLALPTGATTSTAIGVSGIGSVVVGAIAATSGESAYRWSGTDTGLLGALPSDGLASMATAVSADGRVVVGNGNFEGNIPGAWRWTQGAALLERLQPPSGDGYTLVRDTNEDGAVIVGGEYDAVNASWSSGEALIWDEAGVHRVRERLLAAGVPLSSLAGWKLGRAVAISLDGKTIFGTGTNPDGFSETWIARLH